MLKVSENWCNNFNLDLYFLFFFRVIFGTFTNVFQFYVPFTTIVICYARYIPVLCSVHYHCHLLHQVYSSSMFRSPLLSSATPGIFQFCVPFTTIIIWYTRYIPGLCSVHHHYHLLHQRPNLKNLSHIKCFNI